MQYIPRKPILRQIHISLMAPAGDALADYFKTVTFAEPQLPVLFNCLGDVKDDTITIPELLVKQVQSSVFMEDSIRKMASMGVDAIVYDIALTPTRSLQYRQENITD